MSTRTLTVHLDGRPVASLSANRPGRVECRYLPAAFDLADLGQPLLSCSLPLRRGKQEAYAFASGLLPEGQHRQAMAGMAGVPTHDVLGMLARFGRDVAGALVISDGSLEERHVPEVQPYTDEGLASAVAELSDHPLGLYDDTELSLAGLADKMLLVRLPDGSFGRPRYGAATTHILKVDDRLRRGLVRAEHSALVLARRIGLDAAGSELVTVGDTECLVVERFDRAGTGDEVVRVHQEDACQALGIDPEDQQRRAKYERYGGPGWRDVAGLLDAYAADPLAELDALFQYLVFTVLVGNADGHGKNISLLHPRPGEVRLAPLYDTVPTVLWPNLRAEAAMSVNGVWHLPSITATDLQQESASWGFTRRDWRDRLAAVAEPARDAAAAGLPSDEAGSPEVRGLANRIIARAEALLASE